MKKSLLLATLALTAAAGFARTDGVTYETIDGFTCTNKWVLSRFDNLEGWNALPFSDQQGKARTACLAKYNGQDVVIIGWSQTLIEGESSNDYATLVILNFANGDVIKSVQMSCDGTPISGLLCANQVGCDQFGNVWFAGYLGTVYNAETKTANAYKVYKVDDMDAGTCSLVASLTVDEGEADDAAGARIDYCDIVGDVTRENASCTVMAAFSSNNGAYNALGVIGWRAEQGSDEWEPAMDGYNIGFPTETYPADQTDWGTAPVVRIILDDDYTNDLFYVDGFTTCPTLYSNDCGLAESFALATELAPKVGTNGVGEFKLGGKDFIAYSIEQYESPECCRARIAMLGDGQSFDGMQAMWDIPENGLGSTSDGGTRVHPVEARVYTDDSGNEGAYVLTYKCTNGVAVYVVAEEGFVDPNPDAVNDIVVDNSNAPVQYFNLNGVRVNGDNLPAGLYITRQGTTTSKVVIK